MRYLPLLICFVLSYSLSSCEKEPSSEPIDPETMDKVWMKLHIPDQQRGVSAIYGNIDDTLVVATMYKIYLTTDQGKSWQLVMDAKQGISGFAMVEDELVALGAFTFAEESAQMALLHSADHGKTWTDHGKFDYNIYDALHVARKRVELAEDHYYRIAPGAALVDQETGQELARPDEIRRLRDGFEGPVYFPTARRMNYLYLDDNDRLYVGTEGTRFEWDVAGDTRTFPTHTDSAFLYISREPIGKGIF